MAARHQVQEHTRKLANGTRVTVHDHTRTGADGGGKEEIPHGQFRVHWFSGRLIEKKKTPVESHRAARLRKRKKTKRQQNKKKGIVQAQRGGRRLKRAYQAAKRKKKATAACLAVGGIAEVGAWATFQTIGAIAVTLAVIATAVSGALIVDHHEQKQQQKTKPKPKQQQKGKG